ncbi:MAG: Gfo/Idh/MocA family oxidoreductase [Anaerolineae bacterium]|nr:Gfo/Idh/MocA family oxidoreductase [Anaerolineae bacterium]
MATVRIGMVGCGRMGNVHAGLLEHIPEAQIVATCDILPERAEHLAAKWNARPYTDHQAMLAAEDLDAVYVCTPTRSHAEIVIHAAQKGCHIFVEKPFTMDLADAYRAAEAVRQAGVIGCVAYHWRYVPFLEEAEHLLAGKPVSLVVAHWYWSKPPIDWLRDRHEGGGQMVDQVTHLVDLCRHFGGEVEEVYAAYSERAYPPEEFDNWDGYAVTLRCSNGTVGSIYSTYALFYSVRDIPTADIVARDLLIRIRPKELEIQTPRETRVILEEAPHHQFVNQAFVQACAQGRPDLIKTPMDEGLVSLAITLAANESAVRGRPIRMAEFLAEARARAGLA